MGQLAGIYAPSMERHHTWLSNSEWHEVENAFEADWLIAVKEELQGDLWAQLEAQRAMFTAVVPAGDNSPFSDAEQKRIHASLDELLERVKELKLFQREQYERLEAAMTHQKRASGWLGRVDWVNGFMGAVFGQILTVASNPKAVEQFLTLAAGAVSWLHGHAPQLPSR